MCGAVRDSAIGLRAVGMAERKSESESERERERKSDKEREK
jgi:hypothetical protein